MQAGSVGTVKLGIVGIVGLCLAVLLASCAQEEPDTAQDGGTGPIVIASANPMSGDSGYYGTTTVRGIRLAIEELTDNGQIDGREIKLEVQDDASDPTQGANLAQKNCSNEDVVAVVGDWNSSVTLAAVPIYDRCGLVQINANTASKLSGISPYSFRLFSTGTIEGDLMSDYAMAKGYRTAAILYDTNDYGIDLKNAFEEFLREKGGKITTVASYLSGATNFRPQATKVQAANADAIFIGGYHVETALAAKEMRRIGVTEQILAGDGVESPDLMEIGGDAVEGLIFAGNYSTSIPTDRNKEFIQAFKGRYGIEPDTFAALAYDSTALLLEAIREVGADREAIRDFLDEVDGFEGVTGPVTFDANNDAAREIYLIRVHNGEFVLNPQQIRGGELVPVSQVFQESG